MRPSTPWIPPPMYTTSVSKMPSRRNRSSLLLGFSCILLFLSPHRAFQNTPVSRGRYTVQQKQQQSLQSLPRLDVALDQPMPIYFGTSSTTVAGFGIRRMAIIFMAVVVAALSKSLLERILDRVLSRRTSRAAFAGGPPLLESPAVVEEETTRAIIVPAPAPPLVVEQIVEQQQPKPIVTTDPTPMSFDNEEGWGVATVRSKERFGDTGFKKVELELPDPSFYVPLELGEPVSVCCLDRDDEPVQADFFPLPSDGYGSLSVLVKENYDTTAAAVTETTAGDLYSWNDRQQDEVTQVILHDLAVGDQIAIRPSGATRLDYRGPYLPLTSIVYWAVGTGIVPVLDQLRTVLGDDDFAMEQASVIWVNRQADDFDILEEELEDIYNSSPELLNVACLVDEDMEFSNEEIADAISPFYPGMMAVISGPADCTKTALSYLQVQKGFPRDCICVL